MKKILIFTAREGHLSISQAASQVLTKAGFKVYLADIISKKSISFYTPFYRYFPGFFKIPYKMGQGQAVQKATQLVGQRIVEKGVKNEIKEKQPDLIISNYFLNNSALEKVLDYQKNPIPFINIIADPWTIHPLLFSQPAASNLAYDKKGISIGKKNKVDEKKLAFIGWLIKSQFYKQYNASKIRKKFGFQKNIFTLLICGGSEGTNFILKTFPIFLNLKKPLQIIVVCGTNKTLFKALQSFKRFLPKLAQLHLRGSASWRIKTPRENFLNLKLYKFTNQLPQLMAVSDLVVGKAGPNLIFETVAAKKPFMAVCHIAGQEDGNLSLIKKKKLGLVEENPVRAIRLLKKIINKPQILNRFEKFIKKERQYNKEAGDKLVKIVKNLLT